MKKCCIFLLVFCMLSILAQSAQMSTLKGGKDAISAVGTMQTATDKDSPIVAQLTDAQQPSPVPPVQDNEVGAKPIHSAAPIMKAFFVSTTGNDSGDGSESSPFQTIEKALAQVSKIAGNMTGNIVVNVKEGDYYLERTIDLTSEMSGTNGYHVILRSADGIDKARIMGGKKIVGWEKENDKVWKAKIPVGTRFYTMWENGERAMRARYPNYVFDVNFPKSGAPYLLSASGTDTALVYKEGDLDPREWKDTSTASLIVWPWGKCDWNRWASPIQTIDSATRTITIQKGDGTLIDTNARYYVEGVYELLDAPGEFYMDVAGGTLYYIPRYGNPNEQDIVIPTLQKLVSIHGKSPAERTKNMVLDGLRFEYSDFIDQMFAWYGSPDSRKGMVDMTNTDNITVQNCHFRNSGLIGLFMLSANTNNTISGCWFEKIGVSGIILRSEAGEVLYQNLITNTRINDVGECSTDSAGVNMYNATRNMVSYCEIFNSPRYGLSYRGTTAQAGSGPSYGVARGNVTKYVKVYSTNQDSGDTGALHEAGITRDIPGVMTHVNYFEQILVDNIYAHPSMKDLGPNGIFLDYNTFKQQFKNVKISNVQGNYLGDYFRMNRSGLMVLENCSWMPGFDDRKMAYEKIGLSPSFPKEFDLVHNRLCNSLALFVDRNIALKAGSKVPIDPANPLVVPIVYQDRTLLPVRFIVEALGATVDWDEITRTVTVRYQGKTIQMQENSHVMKIDGKEKTIDVPVMIKEGRTLLPLRALAESLGKYVFWDDRGLILISANPFVADPEREADLVSQMVEKFSVDYQMQTAKVTPTEATALMGFLATGSAKEGLMLRENRYEFSSYIAVANHILTYKLKPHAPVTSVTLDDAMEVCIEKTSDHFLIYTQGNREKAIALPATFVANYLVGEGSLQKRGLLLGKPIKALQLYTKSSILEFGQIGTIEPSLLLEDGTRINLSQEGLRYTSSSAAVSVNSDNRICGVSEGESVIFGEVVVDGRTLTASLPVRSTRENPIVMYENFDSYGETDKINGWTITAPSAGGSYVKAKGKSLGVEDQALELYDNDPAVASTFVYSLSPLITEPVTIEADFKVDFPVDATAAGSVQVFYTRNSQNRYNLSIWANRNNICYMDGSITKDIAQTQSGKWYNFKIEANPQTLTSNVYIDGQLVLENASFRLWEDPSMNLKDMKDIFLGSSIAATNTKVYWDNIFVTKK